MRRRGRFPNPAVERSSSDPFATAGTNLSSTTPAHASPAQAAAQSNRHKRRAAHQPPRVPSSGAFGRRFSARLHRSTTGQHPKPFTEAGVARVTPRALIKISRCDFTYLLTNAIQLDKRFLSGEVTWAVVTGSTLFIANHCLVFRPGRRHRPSPTPPAGTTRPLPPTSRPCRQLRRSDGAGSSGRRRPEPADGLDARAGLVAHALPGALPVKFEDSRVGAGAAALLVPVEQLSG